MKQLGDFRIMPYGDLDWQVQEDLDSCIARKTQLHPRQVYEFLREHHEVPVHVIWVDPASLIGKRGRVVDQGKVKEFSHAWKNQSPESFPPVVVDSDHGSHALCEGGHRTKSAIRAKVPAILAIDIVPIVAELAEDLLALRPLTGEYEKRAVTADPWWLERFQGRG